MYSAALTLHEVLAYTEWAGTREGLALRNKAEEGILDQLQLALVPLIAELGTDEYDRSVRAAWESVRAPS